MKYIIPENKLDKIIFKYLDLNLKHLEKRKPKYYEGIVYGFPDEEYGVLGYRTDGTLYVYYDLIEEISNGFGLKDSDSKSLIGRWASDRLQLEVRNTFVGYDPNLKGVRDRLQLEVKNTRTKYKMKILELEIDYN